MTQNPYEPQPPPPFDAGPAVRTRRAEGYSFPPGPSRRFDRRHFRRQDVMTWFFLGLLIGPLVYLIGWDAGWWGRGW